MASSTGIPEHGPSEEHQPLLGRPGDATQLEGQGLQYNLVIGTGMLAQAGIWILAAIVWSSVFMNPLIFFSAHPLLNSAGILLIVQAILVLQPTHTHKQKIQGTNAHAIFNFLGVACLIGGLIIIEINKAPHPENRFKSPHAIFGLIVYILFFLQAFVGFAQFYVPATVFGSVENGKMIYKYHRGVGYIILLMALVAICLAVETGYNKNTMHMQMWAVVVACILVVAGLVPRIKKYKFGL